LSIESSEGIAVAAEIAPIGRQDEAEPSNPVAAKVPIAGYNQTGRTEPVRKKKKRRGYWEWVSYIGYLAAAATGVNNARNPSRSTGIIGVILAPIVVWMIGGAIWLVIYAIRKSWTLIFARLQPECPQAMLSATAMPHASLESSPLPSPPRETTTVNANQWPVTKQWLVIAGLGAVFVTIALLVSQLGSSSSDSQHSAASSADNPAKLVDGLSAEIMRERESAERGRVDSQFNVGLAYFRGDSATQDYAEAMKWMRRAADQGDAEAQYMVGVMYYHGWGVQEDSAEGYKWMSLAVSQSSTMKNVKWLEDARRDRNIVASFVTLQQMADAQEFVQQWTATPEPSVTSAQAQKAQAYVDPSVASAAPAAPQTTPQVKRVQSAASPRAQPMPYAGDGTPNATTLSMRTSSGKTYRMANIWDAVRVGSSAEVAAMLTDRQDVNLREGGTTLLIEATRMSNYSAMEFLLQNGADLNARNSDSRSALDLAQDRSDDTAVNLLRRFGAK
jgi:TPR repeat protein